MTESEWWASTDPKAMVWGLRTLVNLRNKRNRRKLRLFAVACCNRIRHLLEQPDAVRALELAEQVADGQADEAEMLAASARTARIHSGVWDAYQAVTKASARTPTCTFLTQYVDGPDYLAACAVWRSTLWEHIKTDPDPPDQERPNAAAASAKTAERVAQADILRCVFGNPFRPVSIEAGWLTPTVTNLSAVAYEKRALPSGELETARLAVLADAIEEAGCGEPDVLAHCRQQGQVHMRGCWVLDLLLKRA